MVREETWLLPSTVTFAQAPMLLTKSKELFRQGVSTVDFSQVSELDSSALSLLLAWQRYALQTKLPLKTNHMPGSLLSLARLYGVTEFLPPR